jgi:hypothetical protein
MLRIIHSETLSHKVGEYSNGADASVIETIISVIDLKEGKAYRIINNMGGSPPKSTTSRTVDIGIHWKDEDIYNNLKSRIAGF